MKSNEILCIHWNQWNPLKWKWNPLKSIGTQWYSMKSNEIHSRQSNIFFERKILKSLVAHRNPFSEPHFFMNKIIGILWNPLKSTWININPMKSRHQLQSIEILYKIQLNIFIWILQNQMKSTQNSIFNNRQCAFKKPIKLGFIVGSRRCWVAFFGCGCG